MIPEEEGGGWELSSPTAELSRSMAETCVETTGESVRVWIVPSGAVGPPWHPFMDSEEHDWNWNWWWWRWWWWWCKCSCCQQSIPSKIKASFHLNVQYYCHVALKQYSNMGLRGDELQWFTRDAEMGNFRGGSGSAPGHVIWHRAPARAAAAAAISRDQMVQENKKDEEEEEAKFLLRENCFEDWFLLLFQEGELWGLRWCRSSTLIGP